MVIRGNTRGNGQQLGYYLLTLKDNEKILILDVAGRPFANDDYLHQTIYSMQLNSELTNSTKGLYHAQINPAHEEAKQMAQEDWLKAADILGAELGLESQRRIIVLHEKKGRTHAHVVWERYDYETGKIKSDSFSRLAQDRARMKMEEVFSHTPTPRRNKHRPEMKAALTEKWAETKDGKEFIKQAQQAGYMVAAGSMRNPFMVVDENGRSFDLVRQLNGVRIKEVRERMRNEKLVSEKEAIELMRAKKANDDSGKTKQQETPSMKMKVNAFAESRDEIADNNKEAEFEQRKNKKASEFADAANEIQQKPEQPIPQPVTDSSDEKKKQIAREFAENRQKETDEAIEREKKIQEFIAEQKAIKEKNKLNRKGHRY